MACAGDRAAFDLDWVSLWNVPTRELARKVVQGLFSNCLLTRSRTVVPSLKEPVLDDERVVVEDVNVLFKDPQFPCRHH